MGEYRSPKTLSMVVMVLLGLNGVLSLAALPASLVQLDVLERIDQGTIGDDEIAANDALMGTIGLATSAVYLVTAIVFMMWFHRAYVNLEHFGHSREHSTSWAVWSWIVPIISLFRPLQIAREIWHASDPDGRGDGAVASTPPLLSTWWALWILGNVVGQVAFRMSLGADDVASFRSSTMVQMALDALNLVSVPTAILVVREITRRQEERAATIASGGEDVAKVFE